MSPNPTLVAAPRQQSTSIATDISLIAFFTSLIAVCSILPGIPIGILAVPITLQTLAVLLTGAVLGPKRGVIAVLCYLLLGALGLPIFTGGAAGLAVFTRPTSGFLIGFPLGALVTGLLTYQKTPRLHPQLRHSIATIVGALIIAVSGIIGFLLVAHMSLTAAITTYLVYLPGDIIKAILAAITSTVVLRSFPQLVIARHLSNQQKNS